MSPATKFELLVDGERVKSSMYAPHVKTWGPYEDAKLKLFISEFPGGMSGTAVFTGMWFYDSSDPEFGGEFKVPFPWSRCDLTVHFT